jgi:hypothetical protein
MREVGFTALPENDRPIAIEESDCTSKIWKSKRHYTVTSSA